jgi:hypothetical protein
MARREGGVDWPAVTHYRPTYTIVGTPETIGVQTRREAENGERPGLKTRIDRIYRSISSLLLPLCPPKVRLTALITPPIALMC